MSIQIVRKLATVVSLIILFLGCMHQKAAAQQVPCDSIYTLAEQMPVFGKGKNEFFEYLNKNLEVRKPCKPSDLKRILLTISKEGKIIDAEVVVNNDKCKSDLIMQLKDFPDWTPGKDQGKAVCVKITLSIQLKKKG